MKKNLDNLFVFVGDTIFIDGIGRSDLHDKTEGFAHQLYNTYQEKILSLFDRTIILPSHYSGIFGHERPIYDTVKSIKQKINLLASSEDDFVRFISENILPRPMNYEMILSINKHMISCHVMEQKDLEVGPNSCGIVK